jgi:uncharacterized membrane protein YcaP (DUF421 family)
MPLDLQVHRLNFELTQALSKRESACSSKDVIDIDSLIAENTYLHDRLQQMEQEKQIAEHSLSKYKVNSVNNIFVAPYHN